MTSAPLLLRGGGVGALLTFAILWTTLLPSLVTGQGKTGLKCHAQANDQSTPIGEKSCGADKESCCYYLFDAKKGKNRWGCTDDCADLTCKPDRNDEESIQCYCVEANCNADKWYWKGKKDSLYNKFHKLDQDKGASSSTTRPSGKKGALLLVVAALGSLPHLF